MWESFSIGKCRISNRFIRSATHEGFADKDGRPSERHVSLYKNLAAGGLGAIITGYTGIQQDGKSPLHNMLMLDSDDKIELFKKLVSEAKSGTDIKIFLQLAHCGRAARSAITGMPTVAPSRLKDSMYPEDVPKELGEDEIETIINNFVKAAQRAEKCGFDGVQIHGAHGYLLSQFLSSYSNLRTDRWGGSVENRFRIAGEILQRIRKNIPDFPILFKYNWYDNRKSGMRLDQALKIAGLLEESGCDAIEVSCGVPEDGGITARSPKLPLKAVIRYNFKYKKMPRFIRPFFSLFAPLIIKSEKQLTIYNVDAAARIKSRVNIPVFAPGGIHTLQDAEFAVNKAGLDAVSMSRPLILEPGLVNKFREGKSDKARCIKCNYCGVIQEERPLKCYYGKLPEQA